MSLATPAKLRTLQRALYVTAKQEPARRFHALYDKVYRADVLQAAWEQCRGNGGAPGVDQQTFADIERYGVEKWLEIYAVHAHRHARQIREARDAVQKRG